MEWQKLYQNLYKLWLCFWSLAINGSFEYRFKITSFQLSISMRRAKVLFLFVPREPSHTFNFFNALGLRWLSGKNKHLSFVSLLGWFTESQDHVPVPKGVLRGAAHYCEWVLPRRQSLEKWCRGDKCIPDFRCLPGRNQKDSLWVPQYWWGSLTSWWTGRHGSVAPAFVNLKRTWRPVPSVVCPRAESLLPPLLVLTSASVLIGGHTTWGSFKKLFHVCVSMCCQAYVEYF